MRVKSQGFPRRKNWVRLVLPNLLGEELGTAHVFWGVRRVMDGAHPELVLKALEFAPWAPTAKIVLRSIAPFLTLSLRERP